MGATLAHRARALAPAVLDHRLTLLRAASAGAQALTVLVTWPLWQAREDPPVLPVGGLDLPQADTGFALLATLAVAIVRPRLGAALHVAVLAYALAADQTRLQPEVVSLAILLVAATGWAPGLVIGRAHLVALWLWSGLNKLLSTGFFGDAAGWITGGLHLDGLVPDGLVGGAVATAEIALGLAVAIPRTRRAGVVLAFAVHGGILLVLSPFGHDWNRAVWAWNAALPFAAVALFWPPAPDTAEPGRAARWPRVAAVAVVAAPALFYAGVADAYLSHNLYTSNVAEALVCQPDGGCDAPFDATWRALDVPLPPEPRLYRQWFDERCVPGEVLEVRPRQVRVRVGVDARFSRRGCAGNDAP